MYSDGIHVYSTCRVITGRRRIEVWKGGGTRSQVNVGLSNMQPPSGPIDMIKVSVGCLLSEKIVRAN